MPEEKEHIRLKAIIEFLGKPKEHVEKIMKDYVKTVKDNPDIIVLKENYAKLKEQKSMWSTFVELELVFKGVYDIIGFCIDYMPSSIEILKPEELKFSNTNMSDFLNDLQAKLHHLDMVAKTLRGQNDMLKRSLNTTIENLISIILAVKGAMDLENLSKLTGVNEKELKEFLETLIKKQKIKKEEDKYKLP